MSTILIREKKASLGVVALIVNMLVIGMVLTRPASSAENRLIPFQGRLTDSTGSPVKDDVYQITFVIYDKPTGGTALWSEVHSTVSVINGQINVLLGSITSLDDPDGNGDPSDAIGFTSSRFLGIKIGSDSSQEMVPRQQLVPAFHAKIADRALVADHALKADLAINSNNSDKLEGFDSTYFSSRLVPKGVIIMWSGSLANIPTGWALCDGNNGTPDLRDKFIVAAGNSYSISATGGTYTHAHGAGNYQVPSHTHSYSGSTNNNTATKCQDEGGSCSHTSPETYHSHAFSGTTSASGGTLITGTSETASSLPPYYGLAFIMKL